jgi:excinuclease ABC subunit A
MRQREVIKTADWGLDLGPEGGDKGGDIVAEGTPEQVADEPRSYTGGYYLKQPLKGPRCEPAPPRKKQARASAAMREREAAE